MRISLKYISLYYGNIKIKKKYIDFFFYFKYFRIFLNKIFFISLHKLINFFLSIDYKNISGKGNY